jgi:hypothetical protein
MKHLWWRWQKRQIYLLEARITFRLAFDPIPQRNAINKARRQTALSSECSPLSCSNLITLWPEFGARSFGSNEAWNQIKSKAPDDIQLFFYCWPLMMEALSRFLCSALGAINFKAHCCRGCRLANIPTKNRLLTSSEFALSIEMKIFASDWFEPKANIIHERGEFCLSKLKPAWHDWWIRPKARTNPIIHVETTSEKCFSDDVNWYSGCDVSGENRRNDERAESSVFRVNFDGFDSSVRAQIDGFPLKDN